MPDLRPAAVADLASLVQEARARQTALFPEGGGTMRHYGLPPARSGPTVELTGLSQVIDYPARDMTITVQAGIRLQQLHDLLRREHQRLPIDVPLPDQATVGGAIAANASGPRRFGNGTFRDYLLGFCAINDEGREIKAGGRVVKNVAGYDLCKLFTGSFGTLGILTQVTLKVRPAPEASALVGATCSCDLLADVLEGIQRTQTRPCAVEVLSSQTAKDLLSTCGPPPFQERAGGEFLSPGDAMLMLGFEDNAEAVQWQVRQLEQELAADQAVISGVWHGDDHPFWAAMRDYPLLSSPVTFQASLPSSRVADFFRLAIPVVPRLQAHAGNGIVIGHAPERFTPADLRQLRSHAEINGGSLVLHRCPDSWRKAETVWGMARCDWALMRKVKGQLDPHNLFNSGRFLAG